MPSPFPGMDPFLEAPARWPEFHRLLMAALHDCLRPGLVDRYTSAIRTRQYTSVGDHGTEQHAEDYLEIGLRNAGQLVTLLEVVSPANKTTAAGRQAYLDQRRKARSASANLVEIDLVLQGQPTLEYSREGLPDWDYAVTVTRSTQPDRYEIYTATLQKRLPRFRLPLASDDRDTVLDLHTAFTRCYDRGGYAGRIDYGCDPAVPLGEEKRLWVDAWLREQHLRPPLPTHEAVARLAYHLWQAEGCAHGRDREHWYEAERQLRHGEARGRTGARHGRAQ